jgi:hypothetical protein
VHFIPEARVARDGIINIDNNHQWTEKNPNTSSSSALICGQGLFVIVRYVLAHRLTGNNYENSPYMICQIYWMTNKMSEGLNIGHLLM